MIDQSGKEIPKKLEHQIGNYFWHLARDMKDDDLHCTYEWGSFCGICSTHLFRNYVTFDYMLIRIWNNAYPLLSYDIFSHNNKLRDRTIPIIEKYIRDMHMYYTGKEFPSDVSMIHKGASQCP